MSKFVGLAVLLIGGSTIASAAPMACSSFTNLSALIASSNTVGPGGPGYDANKGCTIDYKGISYTFDYFQFGNTSSTNTALPQAGDIGVTALNINGVGFDFTHAGTSGGKFSASAIQDSAGNWTSVDYAFELRYSLASVSMMGALQSVNLTTSGMGTSLDGNSSVTKNISSNGDPHYRSVTLNTLVPGTLLRGVNFDAGGLTTFGVVDHFTITSGTLQGATAYINDFANLFSPDMLGSAVPEPASVALLGTCIAAFALTIRRRRKA
jgi:hypothetical protein